VLGYMREVDAESWLASETTGIGRVIASAPWGGRRRESYRRGQRGWKKVVRG
jgi:hypothetical protein